MRSRSFFSRSKKSDWNEPPFEYPTGIRNGGSHNDRHATQTSISPQQFRSGRDPKPNDKFVAIMGVTGSGKSSFISLLTGGKAKIGSGLEACTSQIDVYPYNISPDQTVYLIDTPGFNDTYKDDAQILVEITSWLTSSYNHKVYLNGVIYLHDITQGRMYGSSLKTMRTFKELSGPGAMKKVILTTTHWDIVPSSTLAQCEAREKQLMNTETFWGSMIAQGSRVKRHNNSKKSAESLVRSIVGQSQVTLAVQSQMVDEHKKLSETSAGKSLGMDMVKKMEDNYQQQLEELRQLRMDKKQSDAAQRQAQKEHRQELAQMRKKLELTSREMNERMERELAARERKFRSDLEAHRREQAELYAQRERYHHRGVGKFEPQTESSEEDDSDDDDDDDDDEDEEDDEDDSDEDDEDEDDDDEETSSESESDFDLDHEMNQLVIANNNGHSSSRKMPTGYNGVYVDDTGVYTNGVAVNNKGVFINGQRVSDGSFGYNDGSSVVVNGNGLMVNGRRIPYNGGSVSVVNGRVMVNGRAV